MSGTSVRAMKEFRLVAWPAAGVTSCAVLALVMLRYKMEWGPVNPESLTAGGFFAGLPLLAGLGIGSEFQYRTLVLNLAQPLHRDAMWRAKNLVALAIMALPAALFCFGATSQFADSLWMPLLYVITFSAAAFPMTLIARSTIGGAALNALATCPVFWGAVWVTQYLRSHDRLTTVALAAVTLFLLSYSAGMAWLGRRMFLRLQAAEGMQSFESILPGAGFVPAALSDWLGCRPSQMFLNLVRRELRLLRLIWPLTFLSVAAWSALIGFHILPIDDKHLYRMPFLVVTVMLSALIALLGGSLSLGEEKSWGTHDWQLTLPISPSLQWFVKLATGIFISVLCGSLVPMSVLYVAHSWSGNPAYALPKAFALLWSADMVAVTVLAFWASCMVKGTAKASMLVFPACAIAVAGLPLGGFVGESLIEVWPRLFDSLISAIGPIPAFAMAQRFGEIFNHIESLMLATAVFVVGVFLLQSHRFYGEQSEDRPRRIARRLAPIFLLTLFAGFMLEMTSSFAGESSQCAHLSFYELHLTVERARQLHPQSSAFVMDSDQLTSGVALSPETRRYLAGSSTLIISQEPPRTFLNYWGYYGRFGGRYTDRSLPYMAVIRTARGETCVMSFHRAGEFSDKARQYGTGAIRCE